MAAIGGTEGLRANRKRFPFLDNSRSHFVGTSLSLMLITSMILGQSDGIKGISVLTANEWSGSSHSEHDGVQRNDTFMLSLRPGEKLARGTAFFLMSRMTLTRRRGRVPEHQSIWLEAYKGRYTLYTHPDEKDILIISLGFTKRYRGTPLGDGENVEWTADQSFKPQGADFHLTLDEGRTVPEELIEISVNRGYYVDEDGEETVARYAPSTFSERLVGAGKVKTVRYLPFANIGQTLRFLKGDFLGAAFEDGFRAPPTYRSRPLQIDLTIGEIDSILYPELYPPEDPGNQSPGEQR